MRTIDRSDIGVDPVIRKVELHSPLHRVVAEDLEFRLYVEFFPATPSATVSLWIWEAGDEVIILEFEDCLPLELVPDASVPLSALIDSAGDAPTYESIVGKCIARSVVDKVKVQVEYDGVDLEAELRIEEPRLGTFVTLGKVRIDGKLAKHFFEPFTGTESAAV